MSWLAWIALSNVGIFWLEYCYRIGKYDSFIHALPYIVIPMMMGQVGLFYGFRAAPNLLLAGATFTLINVVLRVVNSYMLNEPLNWYNWSGVALLIVATVLIKVK
jgi:hypothetical protein